MFAFTRHNADHSLFLLGLFSDFLSTSWFWQFKLITFIVLEFSLVLHQQKQLWAMSYLYLFLPLDNLLIICWHLLYSEIFSLSIWRGVGVSLSRKFRCNHRHQWALQLQRAIVFFCRQTLKSPQYQSLIFLQHLFSACP